jgi:hypothetical protein
MFTDVPVVSVLALITLVVILLFAIVAPLLYPLAGLDGDLGALLDQS